MESHDHSSGLRGVMNALMGDAGVRKALDYLQRDEAARLEELKELVVVHGAPFKEAERRSPMFLERMARYGAKDCVMDEIGNVLGYVHGSQARPKVLVEGHLDTVFAEDVPLVVTEKDGFLFCPGIGDDTAALASVLSLLRAIAFAGLKPVATLVLGGTVGEEGEGNSRGIRHLLKTHDDIDTVISVESHSAAYVLLEAVGICRYEYSFAGPGGHSWHDFGRVPNTIHAMGRAIAAIAAIKVPARTSYSVGVVSGGTSINAIAQAAVMKVDMRSTDPAALSRLMATVQELVDAAVAEENGCCPEAEGVTLSRRIIGSKPAGSLSRESLTAQVAVAAGLALGIEPQIANPGSTNQNIPVNMGIPALVVGSGGVFRDVHRLKESYCPEGSYLAAQKLLLLLFALVGLDGVTAPLAVPCLERGPVC